MSNKSLQYLKQHETEYVEEPFLQQLEGLGWQIIRLKMDSQGGQKVKESYRSDFSEVLLLPILRESLLKINPWLEADQIEDVIAKLNIKSSNKLLETNQALLNLLLENPITAKDRKINKSKTVCVVDFESPDNNSFIAISQLKIKILGTERHIYPYIVLFLNGLPVVVVECKSPKAQDVSTLKTTVNIKYTGIS